MTPEVTDVGRTTGRSTIGAVTESTSGRSAKAAEVRQCRISVVAGPDAGKTVATAGGRLLIGSHPSADLFLHDKAASRFHCELILQEGRVLIRDLGSRNGTLVDGVAVAEGELKRTSTLMIGATQLRIDFGKENVKIPVSERESFGSLFGHSVAMRSVFAVLESAAASEATVLIEGETGTGKELTAESIHRESARKSGPFVIVDCAAVPPNLLESELFGHERGAFTGAVTSRKGAFESAHGGTIFLDEVGELSLDLQPKLLRALERKEVKPVGGNRYAPVDVRVIAATNRNLRAETNSGAFRSDLYFRLAVLEVTLPPLRDRPEDLPGLVEEILKSFDLYAEPRAALARTPEFIEDLARHRWAGNVRELRNFIERTVALGRTPEDPGEPALTGGKQSLAGLVDSTKPLRVAREAWEMQLERRYLEELLRRHNDRVSSAAEVAGIDRTHFHRLLRRHGIKR